MINGNKQNENDTVIICYNTSYNFFTPEIYPLAFSDYSWQLVTKVKVSKPWIKRATVIVKVI